MDIVFLLSHLPNPRMVKRVATALSAGGNTAVVCWDRGIEVKKKNPLPEGVTCHEIYVKGNEGKPLSRLGTTMKFLFKAMARLVRLQPKLIYTSKLDMLILARIYCLLRKNPPKIIYEVSDMHQLVFESPRNLVKKFLKNVLIFSEKIMCRKVSLLVVTSPGFYAEYYGSFIRKEDMMFIPNMPRQEAFASCVGKSGGTFTIGWIGLVRYKTQMKIMIDAAEECGINVFIAGNGVDYEEIREYSRGKPFVEFYGPYQYDKEISSLYGKVDCICAVYDSSIRNVRVALPNRLYEAVLCGVPVIASSGTALGRQVEELNVGLTVDAFSREEMCKAIDSMKDKSELYKSKVEQCNKLRDEFTYDGYAESLVKTMTELLK